MMIQAPVEVRAGHPGAGNMPLLIQPADTRCSLPQFVDAQRSWVEEALTAHGAILFRDFAMEDPSTEFARFSQLMSSDLLDYVYRSTPRTQLEGKIYTATEYPARSVIPQHNENAYCRDWPMKLMLVCVQPALVGGNTPLSSTRNVTKRIDPQIREKFKRLGVKYVRNYRADVDIPWQTVFQTDSKDQLENFCRAHDIAFTWLNDGALRTEQVCQGMATHPNTNDELWFNQAHLFHASSLDKASYNALLALYQEDEFPRNTYYGDGTPIEPEVLADIRAALAAETISFRWKKNDILLLDNMLVAHGRDPFSGPRKVLVSMGESYLATTKS
ncbi:MAG: TauD/TfdA family dioxygenase [Telluria sp.]